MQGNINDKGIMARTAGCIFAKRDALSQKTTCEVKLSVLEIYQEKLRDLLREKTMQSDALNANIDSLRIRETGEGNTWVEGLIDTVISNESQFTDHLSLALRRRSVGGHAMNADSSRSHLCCIISLLQFTATLGQRIASKIYLVDLAGRYALQLWLLYKKYLVKFQSNLLSLSSIGAR